MPPRFKSPLRDQPLLIAPDLNDWVPKDHIVWFYIDSVRLLNLPIDEFYVNYRGNGKPQYDPHMMLTLLLYCASRGVRSSRKMEDATHDSVAVRLIMGNLHPDHDTINEFRRNNKKLFEKVFVAILCLAERCHMLKLGDISLDSTQIKANASRQKSYRIEPLTEKINYYQGVIDEIMTQMDASNNENDTMPTEVSNEERVEILKNTISQIEKKESNNESNNDAIPTEVSNEERDKTLNNAISQLGKLERALRALTERADEDLKQRIREAERIIEEREQKEKQTGKKSRAKTVEIPDTPVYQSTWQGNSTDPDSRVMKKQTGSNGTIQGYNVQIAADNTFRFILSTCVTNMAIDYGQMGVMVKRVIKNVGTIQAVAADLGYASAKDIEYVESLGVLVLTPIGVDVSHRKQYESRIADQSGNESGPPVSCSPGTESETSIREIKTHDGKTLLIKPGRRPPKKKPRRLRQIRDPRLKAKSEQMQDPELLARYQVRNRTIEPINGIIKNVYDLRQFKCRGLENVQTEMTIVASSYNIHRLYVLCRQHGVRI